MTAYVKPHRTIREHKKSRLGCFTCKRRKVKCDQARPICGACHLRKTSCQYLENHHIEGCPPAEVLTRGAQPSAITPCRNAIISEPEIILPSKTSIEMRFLWFFTAHTSKSLLAEQYDESGFGKTVQTLVVQEALEHTFLMKTLFVIAGLHMQHLGQAIDAKTIGIYRAESLRGYRDAIHHARPAAFPALLANSVLIAASSCGNLKDRTSPDLFVLDWLILWRGIRCINTLFDGAAAKLSRGIEALLVRPTMDMEDVTSYIPLRLQSMLSTTEAGDQDLLNIGTYWEALFCLGALYKSLFQGDQSSTALMTVTWITYLPESFIQAAKNRMPRPLVILAYYCGFFKILRNMWWIEGTADRCIRDMYACLGSSWRHEMEIPLLVAASRNDAEASSLLLSELSELSCGASRILEY